MVNVHQVFGDVLGSQILKTAGRTPCCIQLPSKRKGMSPGVNSPGCKFTTVWIEFRAGRSAKVPIPSPWRSLLFLVDNWAHGDALHDIAIEQYAEEEIWEVEPRFDLAAFRQVLLHSALLIQYLVEVGAAHTVLDL